jgi:hypothetical protein
VKIVITVIVLLSSVAKGQSIVDDFVSDVKQSVSLGIDYYNIGRFDSDDLFTAGTVIVPTLLLMPIDGRIKENTLRINRTPALDQTMNIFRSMGEITYILPAVGVTYTAGLLSRSDGLRRVGRELVQSLLYAGLTTTVVKSILGRVRPYAARDQYEYRPFKLTEPYVALPSGHATAVFAVASVLAEESENTFVQCGLYLLAAGTAFSRVYHNQHWASDVFLAAAIGTTTGLFVVHHNNSSDSAGSLSISPSLGSVQLQYTF